MTEFTIFLSTSSGFFFGLRGFFNSTVSTTSSCHSFGFSNRYPFGLPVRFQLLNLGIFPYFYRFAATQPRFAYVCLCFHQVVPRISLTFMLKAYSSQDRRGIRILSIRRARVRMPAESNFKFCTFFFLLVF